MGENGLHVGYKPLWKSIPSRFDGRKHGGKTQNRKSRRRDALYQGLALTFGAATRELDALIAQCETAIATQVTEYPELPWHHATLV